MHIPEPEKLRDLLGYLAGAVNGPRNQKLSQQLHALHGEVFERDPRETVEEVLPLLHRVAKLGADGRLAVHNFRNSIDD